jgi:hypothetical protein
LNQGSQIFLCNNYQNVWYIPNDPQIDQTAEK